MGKTNFKSVEVFDEGMRCKMSSRKRDENIFQSWQMKPYSLPSITGPRPPKVPEPDQEKNATQARESRTNETGNF